MNSYRIITDSCCDFTDAQYLHYNVHPVKLTVLWQGREHRNFSEDTQLHEFYESMRRGATATTSAVNPEEWKAAMEEALKQNQDVLCLTFSSALSTTSQSACIAAAELREAYPQRKIRVVDTLCAALGQGLLLVNACRKRDEGMELDALADWVEEEKAHLAHWVTVDDLDHLKRGGRISAATAFVGGMLNIKPIIHMDDEGKLATTGKCRGRKAAMEHLVARFLEDCTDPETIAIAHGDCPEDAAQLEALLRSKCPAIREVITGYVGGVIGAHTGPGVLVVFFRGKKR